MMIAVMVLMTAAVVLSLVWPLAGRRAARSGPSADVGFYVDLLREVDDDIARGLVVPAEAETTRAEIGRRLLAAGRDRAIAPSVPAGFRRRRIAAIVAAAALVPLLAVGLYLVVGAPGQPDEPLEARASAPNDLPAALARIETHLQSHPEDGKGFELIAPIYLRLGRIDDAVRAYQSAITASGETAARESALGQAMVMAADGVVTTDARAVFEKSLALDPGYAEARFFVAVAAEQDNDRAKATALWQALLADTPADAPWRPAVQQHLAGLSGTAPSVSVDKPADAAADAPAPAPPGTPTGPAAAAIAALPAGAQLQAIHGMVDGLAARLAQNGRDVEGWLRLIKAYTVLGEGDRAQTAVKDARAGLAGDGPALTRIDAEARELGLGG